ncbi:MAG: GntR family transcriptional regulator [Dysosmobacter sp.]
MKQGNPADIVYDYIKNQIVTKAIYPGTRIVEEDLVRETGVSRTPVRFGADAAGLRTVLHPAKQPNRGAVVAQSPPPRICGGRCMRHGLCWRWGPSGPPSIAAVMRASFRWSRTCKSSRI